MTPWDLVLLTVCITYVTFKALTLRDLSPVPALAYVALWPGMEPEPFGVRTEAREGLGLMAWGAVKMVAGAILLSSRTGHIWVDSALILLPGTAAGFQFAQSIARINNADFPGSFFGATLLGRSSHAGYEKNEDRSNNQKSGCSGTKKRGKGYFKFSCENFDHQGLVLL